MMYLAALVNLLTSVLGILTLVCYVFVYTPLKRVTTLNTLVGAIPGALPPLMGWTGATNQVTAGGWALFAILFFWQLPHFYAIAWLYRDDYAKAGYAMLPVVDATGERTGRQAVSHTLGLLTMSLFPVVFGLAGVVYGAGALVLGAGFLVLAIRFSRRMTAPRARALFFASIIYLPLLLALLVFDKVKG
jgi:protoheme IX farnesyltransferase